MNNKDEKVSIIMPAYNCEKEISNSIESVLKQEYGNFELIIINDGSTDNTSGKVAEYIKNDKRIKLFNQENCGPSAARNKGLMKSSGKYIMFIDSDDEYVPTTVESMVKAIQSENAQLAVGNFITNYEKLKNNKQKTKKKIFESTYNMIEYMISKNIFNTNWNKIYLKEIIEKNKIMFDQNIKNGEDMRFNLQYLCYTKKCLILDEVIYKYYFNENGLTSVSKETLGSRIVNDYKYQLNYYEKNRLNKNKLSKRIAKSLFYINDLDFTMTSSDFFQILSDTKYNSLLNLIIFGLIKSKQRKIISLALSIVNKIK